VIVTTTTDKYKLHSPEVMHEPAMSDEDEDGAFISVASSISDSLILP